jgi:hypothetical protein
MSSLIERPFDSIEDAQQYIRLLGETIAEAIGDIDDEITLATQRMSDRRVQDLRVVQYNLEKLKI